MTQLLIAIVNKKLTNGKILSEIFLVSKKTSSNCSAIPATPQHYFFDCSNYQDQSVELFCSINNFLSPGYALSLEFSGRFVNIIVLHFSTIGTNSYIVSP